MEAILTIIFEQILMLTPAKLKYDHKMQTNSIL